tara:strand:- start:314 stop:748 length:435 start_codon:yes stop_codon:yes gene_type:complete
METVINQAFEQINKELRAAEHKYSQDLYEKIWASIKNKDYDQFKYLQRAVSGSWWMVVYGRDLNDIAEIVDRNVDRKIEKRTARIVKALNKKGINELKPFTLEHNGNGYNGTFKVGEHTVIINTRWVAGYDIVCLHERTNIRVK